MVGVNRDGDGVRPRDLVDEPRHRECAGGSRLDGVSGEEVSATRRDLNNSVGTGFGEALQHGVDCRRRRHIDRGECKDILLGGVQHFGVLVGRCDGHGSPRDIGLARAFILLLGAYG